MTSVHDEPVDVVAPYASPVKEASPVDVVAPIIESLFVPGAAQGASLVVVVPHRGEVVLERYGTQPATPFGTGGPVGPGTALISWSMPESILHAAVGILVAEGGCGSMRRRRCRSGPAPTKRRSRCRTCWTTFIGSSYVHATARDFATFGELYRNNGVSSG